MVHQPSPPLWAQDTAGQVHARAAVCCGLIPGLLAGETSQVWGGSSVAAAGPSLL